MNDIYLDNASTTKPLSSITEAIMPYIEKYWHNPSSLYSKSKIVRDDIERVRTQVAELISAKPEEIYFTSGAAEANNWVIRGFDDACGSNDGKIFTTTIEHSSIIKATKNPNLRSSVHYISVNKLGMAYFPHIDLPEVDKNSLVSIIAANNEIGTIQDLKFISDVVHHYGGIFHTDATQMIPYMKINVQEMGIDMLSASAQKLGGLKGTGFLYIKDNVKDKIAPFIYGEQERGYRGGTENVIGIIAMGEAIKHIDYKNASSMVLKRECLVNELESIGCKIIGNRHDRLPNNINVMLPDGCGGEEVLYMLDMSGICVSTGSACNSSLKEPSHVLKSIGLTDEEANRVIRITFSNDLTLADICIAVDEIEKAIKLINSNDCII